MAKYKKQKVVTTKGEATRYLKKVAGAEYKGKGKSGIAVTGKLKEYARESRYDKRLLSALRIESSLEADLAEKRLEQLENTFNNVSDQATLNMFQDYMNRYIKNLQSLDRARKSNKSAIQLVNRLEELANYNESSYQAVRNPTKYFEDYKAGVNTAVMNNLLGSHKIKDMDKEDYKKLMSIGEELGFNNIKDMNDAWEKWSASNTGSDQFSIVLQNLSNEIRDLLNGGKISKTKQCKIDEFLKISGKYGI